MKKYIMMILMLFMTTAVPISAQNSIDDMVGKYSSHGSSTFTSVVTRARSGGKISKVVKTLKMSGMFVDKFEKAFIKASDKGVFTRTKSGDEVTLLLTVEEKAVTRVYMLTYDKRRCQNMEVIVIVKFT